MTALLLGWPCGLYGGERVTESRFGKYGTANGGSIFDGVSQLYDRRCQGIATARLRRP